MLVPFNYSRDVFGGTEYMAYNFHKKILPDLPKLKDYLCLIIPGLTPSLNEIISSPKQVICWMHNTPKQYSEEQFAFIKSNEFSSVLKYLIVLSESHKKIVLEQTSIPEEKIYIINNAIHPLKYNKNKFKNIDQIKLIHTSSEYRGMEILIDSLKYIKEDIRLEIYNTFNPDIFPDFVFDPRIRFFGKTPKQTVVDAYENSHIFAYPATYEETFCLSLAESMSAGLVCVTSDIGALPETSGGLTTLYSYTEDKDEHAKAFAEKILESIDLIKSKKWNPKKQIDYVNKSYSWDSIKAQWLKFHEIL